jgi:hypothetical protein
MARKPEGTDVLVPDPVVAREFAVTLMTLSRWTHDQNLGFPPPIKMRGRNYRSRAALEAFKAQKIRDGIAGRGGRAA